MISAQHRRRREEGSDICQLNAFLARGYLATELAHGMAKKTKADLQYREGFVKDRLAGGRTEEIKESGLRADVHCQFRVRIHAGLHGARIVGSSIVAPKPVFVCGYIQAYGGVEVEEHG